MSQKTVTACDTCGGLLTPTTGFRVEKLCSTGGVDVAPGDYCLRCLCNTSNVSYPAPNFNHQQASQGLYR